MSLHVTTGGVRAVVLLAGVLALAACDGPGPLSKKAKEGDAAPPAAPAAPPMPAAPKPPGWAPALLGQELTAVFPNALPCEGGVDGLGDRYQDAVTVTGWAWNTEAKAPVARVVAVNRKGRFVGFGEGGQTRPAVAEAPDVTYQRAGWSLVTGAPAKNGVRVYGIDEGARAACLLGEVAPIP
ncbi:hypothetical protein [Phenylobacterium sp. J367]|uniref:hypothetical protein n=1 Tax=Phenylobacterium sp. J367 TaxID=2898435 RepID=UPI0021516488|nr:hypothetical protein [Phenylobacterium sp. J367]MCR5879120.1 hypothetical protein [Phenylobacterium sp. J367]